MYKPDRDLPAHITIPNWSAYQIRIVRDGIEHSASFSWAQYAGESGALEAAVEWRDAKLEELGQRQILLRDKPLRHKKSGCPAGITAYFRVDRRREGHPQYLTYGVNYIQDGKARTKSFQVGNIEIISQLDKEHAALSAMAFRDEYVWCRHSGVAFQPNRYNNWRVEKMYPFKNSMKIKVSTTLFDEMEPAIADAVKSRAAGTPDPTDPVYLNLHEATWRKSGILIDATDAEIKELLSRAQYKIEVALENMSDEPTFWRGQLAAWRALIRQIHKGGIGA